MQVKNPMIYRRSTLRIVIYSFLPLLFLIGSLEIGIRCYFYYREGPNSFAITQAYDSLRWRVLKKLANWKVTSGPDFAKNHDLRDMFHRERLLETELGQRLYDHYKEKYRVYFSKLYDGINDIDALLVILYPDLSGVADNSSEKMFFKALANTHDLPFISTGSIFEEHGQDVVTLQPQNGHLSRFGNILLARQLIEGLNKFRDHRSSVKYDTRPSLFGGLTPNSNRIWLMVPNMPYRVITSSQGLRMESELQFPAVKQRVLLLGDSFTFGPYLDNHDTYPAIAQRLDPDREYVNAGVAGYSIAAQTALFLERATFVEPDIVVLQVLDNDILPGMTTYKMNLVHRENRVYEYSDVEKEFIREQLEN